jgi:hypothetical protein
MSEGCAPLQKQQHNKQLRQGGPDGHGRVVTTPLPGWGSTGSGQLVIHLRHVMRGLLAKVGGE